MTLVYLKHVSTQRVGIRTAATNDFGASQRLRGLATLLHQIKTIIQTHMIHIEQKQRENIMQNAKQCCRKCIGAR